ncbi:alpha/beta fold hydrolase [Palleronia caenipelagi]|uniref:Alpha/beta hydrolase n=1 Tax=Palleronia caenipelagi TaxID=2489174 RepID=A0A547Q359_9RHOB|nr:alpha/beta hydrolase [Palleronia caenipelagi]TRD20822.1 alpha/beta hydrolase [Palleronia caenipelagi]
MIPNAPLHEDVADAPPDGRAVWLFAEDGARIRAAHWLPEGPAKGTVFLFPGRTEYIEKYGQVIGDLVAAGHAVLVVDWRGQGLSTRLLDNPLSGHVEVFHDYQKDVAALVDYAQSLDLPRPWRLLAHSMGGTIALRALLNGMDVQSVALSAPMWGITIPGAVRPLLHAAAIVAKRVGHGHRQSPGIKNAAYPEPRAFEDNRLTHDREQYRRMTDQTRTHHGLALGPPSLSWLAEALDECHDLAKAASPEIPCLAMIGTDESIVKNDEIRRRMATWPGGELLEIDGARHECLMETPERRRKAIGACLAHFERY